MKISDTQVKTIEWDESCKMTSDTGAWNAGARQDTTIQLFNDSDLKELIKNKDSGMVYVWDPGMVYSSKFFTQFKKVADKNKMRFTSLLAPNSNPQIAREVAAQNNFQLDARQVASSEMLMRFTSAHYPKTFIYNNGQLAVYPIMGVTSEEELNALVAKGKKQLK